MSDLIIAGALAATGIILLRSVRGLAAPPTSLMQPDSIAVVEVLEHRLDSRGQPYVRALRATFTGTGIEAASGYSPPDIVKERVVGNPSLMPQSARTGRIDITL